MRRSGPWARRRFMGRSWWPTTARSTSGSVNLTPTSLDDNRELGLLLVEPQTAAEVAEIVAADAAGGTAPVP